MDLVKKKSIYESEAAIKSNENLVGIGLWNIGNELKSIRDNKSYTEKGYSSFEEYSEKELNYSRRHCYRFIEIAESYTETSMSQIVNLGMTKILALAQIEEKEREAFIEKNPVEDMTTRELRQAIKEKKQVEKERDKLLQENEKLKNQEPRVIEKPVPVVPDDYEELKKNSENKVDKVYHDRLRKEFTEKVHENHELKKQIEKLAKQDSKVKYQEKLKDSALTFCTRVHAFLNDVGGLAWLTEYIDELDDYDRRSYEKALDLIEGWVLTVKSNMDREEL